MASTVLFAGSAGNDTILGSLRDERVSGGAGADNIILGDGQDVLFLEAGDVVSGERMQGGLGDDVLRVLDSLSLAPAALVAGFEWLSIDANRTVTVTARSSWRVPRCRVGQRYGAGRRPAVFNFANTAFEATVLFRGSAGADTVIGSARSERVAGGAGADSINLGGGEDALFLEAGDVVTGERLNGGLGTDVLRVLDTLSLAPAALVAGFEQLSINANRTVTITAQQLAGFRDVVSPNGTVQGAAPGYSTSPIPPSKRRCCSAAAQARTRWSAARAANASRAVPAPTASISARARTRCSSIPAMSSAANA